LSRPRPQRSPPLDPQALAEAPELASLAIVEGALRTALVALRVEHPTLDDLAEPQEPPSLHRARRLVASAAALAVALRRYRVAVLAALRPRPAPASGASPF
jgi:hypothetical protein